MTKTKKVSLALQGGGAHAAFGWGVLDRLLEEESIEISAISGSSVGAIHGALLSYGMHLGGRSKAKECLEAFWRKISRTFELSPLRPTFADKMLGNMNLNLSPSMVALDFITRVFSPYQFNLFDINPLRDILKDIIDFDMLQKQTDIALFVSATNVHTGRSKRFINENITLESLLASSCLPYIFKTVKIDNEHYWDGGYSGNPSLLPLIYQTDSSDIMIVQTTPINNDETPIKAPDILDRATEISFNSNLIHEIQRIAFVNRLLKKNVLQGAPYRLIHIHIVEAEEILANLGRSSKLNGDWEFVNHLKDTGRQVAEDWLASNADSIGKDSSVDVQGRFVK